MGVSQSASVPLIPYIFYQAIITHYLHMEKTRPSRMAEIQVLMDSLWLIFPLKKR